MKQNKWKRQTQFLCSSESNGITEADAMVFSCKLKEFNTGKLKNVDEKRICNQKFERIEKIVIEYIELCEKLYQKDKCGLSWQFLAAKALKAVELLGITDFSASAGWM
jgi:hypothetical protein